MRQAVISKCSLRQRTGSAITYTRPHNVQRQKWRREIEGVGLGTATAPEEKYHRPLDEELPRLEFVARKVARVHGSRDDRLPQIAETFGTLKTELEHHFRKEEAVLFPAILAKDFERLACPIEVMLKDHDDASELLALLRS